MIPWMSRVPRFPRSLRIVLPLRIRIRALWFLAGAAAFLHAHPLLAQAPDQPDLKRTTPPWIGMFVIAILAAVVILISLLPSKRSHQD